MKMKKRIMQAMGVMVVFFFACNKNDDITISDEPNKPSNDTVFINQINDDLDLYDGKTYVINHNIDEINGSINMGDKTQLFIRHAVLNFNLSEDLEYGIYLEDSAQIIISYSEIKSENKMWEFELRGDSRIQVSDSDLKNHSAVKLFNNCSLIGYNSLIEELRMDNQSFAHINKCEIYPNMQFFFSLESPLEFPETYSAIDFILDNSPFGGWSLEMQESVAQGWQVDVKPNTEVVIKNSIDITLALWSNGQVNDSIKLVNPEGLASNFTLTEFGSSVQIINSEVYFINIYLKNTDKLVLMGDIESDEYQAKYLEIVLNDDSELSIYNSHIFGQLFHANDDSKVRIYHCLIGSTDPEDPINSEFGIKDNARAYAINCDITNSDILIEQNGILELKDCTYDEDRVYIYDNAKLIINE